MQDDLAVYALTKPGQGYATLFPSFWVASKVSKRSDRMPGMVFVDVDYIVFEDEGHAIRKSSNKLILARAMERFFALHLGGRSERHDFRKADAVSVTKSAQPLSGTQ